MRKLTTVFIIVYWLSLFIGPGLNLSLTAAKGETVGSPALLQARPALEDALQDTPQVISPILTATPGADGALVHEVGPGETLFGIAQAYGINLGDLLALNGMTETTVIFPGDRLTIRLGATATTSPTITGTVEASHTPSPTRRPPTSTPTLRPPTATPTVTPTPTATPWLRLPEVDVDQRTLGITIIVISVVGLLVVGLTAFRGK